MTRIFNQAIASDFSDFEDAVQYYAARSIAADAIITRNIKDDQFAAMPVFTAGQYLSIQGL